MKIKFRGNGVISGEVVFEAGETYDVTRSYR
jgi:hypothetical protein